MKRSGMLVALLVGIMLFMIPFLASASSSESPVAPLYLYTKTVKATLTISENGQATWMYYNTDINSDTQVYLMGRPDSSVPSCTVTGKFGAG